MTTTTALESLAFTTIDEHVEHCVSGVLAPGDAGATDEKRRELLAFVRRFTRSR